MWEPLQKNWLNREAPSVDKVLLKKQLASVGRVAVLAGGNSAERPVSLKSGAAVHQALRNLGLI